MVRFIRDHQIYNDVISEILPQTRTFLWLATSDLKDLHVKKGKCFVPFLEILSDLLKNGVSVRLIHAKEPGQVFREDFDRYPLLAKQLERLLCPRVHFKSVIIDGAIAYTGSANLTGAGMGAKSETKRNFEAGIITDDPLLVNQIQQQFDEVWMGKFCSKCKRTEFCPDRAEMLS